MDVTKIVTLCHERPDLLRHVHARPLAESRGYTWHRVCKYISGTLENRNMKPNEMGHAQLAAALWQARRSPDSTALVAELRAELAVRRAAFRRMIDNQNRRGGSV